MTLDLTWGGTVLPADGSLEVAAELAVDSPDQRGEAEVGGAITFVMVEAGAEGEAAVALAGVPDFDLGRDNFAAGLVYG